ncbi:hypothetical protein ROZALSC1DRAFT_29561 [Rozella allomycis CSF55]|uniref:C2 domain-containing protein n=1 Tax=Rozella allomycis (strain CSF55) TaxID=988480 RepID=A0A4P9YIY9_ROZAC|nr:hypothetical protein ROZALSC1DRAFT_29561 [Rozella allomycis CSF55]
MISGGFADTAIGVLKMTIHQARNLPKVDAMGSADAYVKIEINEKEVGRTRIIMDNLNPFWNETLYFLVQNSSEKIKLRVLDYNNLKKDKPIGFVTLDVEPLIQGEALNNQWLQLKKTDFKEGRGEINFDASFSPVIESNVEECNSACGILRMTLHQAKELISKEKTISKLYNPFAEISIYKNQTNLEEYSRQQPMVLFKTRTKKRNNSPTFEETFEVFIHDLNIQTIIVSIYDQRDILAGSGLIGNISIPVKDVIQQDAQKDWFILKNAESGKIRMTFSFKHVNMIFNENLSSMEKNGIGLKHDDVRGKGVYYCRLISSYSNVTARSSTTFSSHAGSVEWKGENLYFPLSLPQELITSINLIDKGLINFQAGYFDLITPETSIEPFIGILSVTVKQLRYFKGKLINPFVELFLNDATDESQRTKNEKKMDPNWDETFEFLILDPSKTKINILVKDQKDMPTSGHQIVGLLSLPLNLPNLNQIDSFFPLKNSENGGELSIAVSYKVSSSLPFVNKLIDDKTPLILQLEIISASNLEAVDNEESSDPFCTVRIGNDKIFKTKVIKKSCNPIWNEMFEIPFDRKNPILTFDVKDWNKVNFSVLLGSANYNLSDLEIGKSISKCLTLSNLKQQGDLNIQLYLYPSLLQAKQNSVINSLNPKKLSKNIRNAKRHLMQRFSMDMRNDVDFQSENDESEDTLNDQRNSENPIYSMSMDSIADMLGDHQSTEIAKTLSKSDLSINANKIWLLNLKLKNMDMASPRNDLYVKIKDSSKTVFKSKTLKKNSLAFNETFQIYLKDLLTSLHVELRHANLITESELVAQGSFIPGEILNGTNGPISFTVTISDTHKDKISLFFDITCEEKAPEQRKRGVSLKMLQ